MQRFNSRFSLPSMKRSNYACHQCSDPISFKPAIDAASRDTYTILSRHTLCKFILCEHVNERWIHALLRKSCAMDFVYACHRCSDLRYFYNTEPPYALHYRGRSCAVDPGIAEKYSRRHSWYLYRAAIRSVNYYQCEHVSALWILALLSNILRCHIRRCWATCKADPGASENATRIQVLICAWT